MNNSINPKHQEEEKEEKEEFCAACVAGIAALGGVGTVAGATKMKQKRRKAVFWTGVIISVISILVLIYMLCIQPSCSACELNRNGLSNTSNASKRIN